LIVFYGLPLRISGNILDYTTVQALCRLWITVITHNGFIKLKYVVMKKMMFRLAIVGSLLLGAGIDEPLHAQKYKKTTKSRKGKYTAIGAGAGAATGVIAGKNDSKSAVIGGVVGAGAGYLYGKHKDKKKGRKVRN
jgi:hypothetical protein